jgi:hypothetical protein
MKLLILLVVIDNSNLNECLKSITQLSYPKNDIALFVYNPDNVNIQSFLHLYKNIEQQVLEDFWDSMMYSFAKNIDITHMFFIRTDVLLLRTDIIEELQKYKRPIIAPLIKSKNNMMVNYEGDKEIRTRKNLGIYTVPKITHIYLADRSIIKEIPELCDITNIHEYGYIV